MVQFTRETKLHSQKHNNEIKNQGYVTEAFLKSPGIHSEPNHDVMFRSAISDSWCPCDGTCPKCNRFNDHANTIQTKLKISEPGDDYEKEADRVAENIVGDNDDAYFSSNDKLKEPMDREYSASEGYYNPKTVQTEGKSNTSNRTNVNPSNQLDNAVRNAFCDVGKPLETPIKEFMDSRFGFDFGNVKIHDNKEAAYSAKIIGALAYTIGNNIVFAEGQYMPNTRVGQRLIAHELSHIKQQTAAEIVDGRIIMRQTDLPSTEDLETEIFMLQVKLASLREEEKRKGISLPETLKVENALATKLSIVAENDPIRKEILFHRARIRELREEMRSTTPSSKREEIGIQIQDHQESLADALETNLERLGLQHEALITKRDTLRASHLWLEGDVNATIEDQRLEGEINAINREMGEAKTEFDTLRRIFKSKIAEAFRRKYEKEIRPLPGGGCMTAVYKGLEELYSPAVSSAIKREVQKEAAKILRETGRDTNSVDRIMETLRTNGMAGNKITARYNSRKGLWEPAVEKIVLGMVDKNYLGWYFFGLSVSGGVHSVVLVVDNSDGLTTKIYWMDQFSRGFTKNVTRKLDKELKDWEPSYGYESTTVWPLIPSAETVVKIPMSL